MIESNTGITDIKHQADYDKPLSNTNNENEYACSRNIIGVNNSQVHFEGGGGNINQVKNKADSPLIIDGNLDGCQKAQCILKMTRNIIKKVPLKATNKFRGEIDKELMRENSRKLMFARRYCGVQRLKNSIANKVGNCGEQARIASVICSVNKIENYIQTYRADSGFFEHSICIAMIGDNHYMIDPWANISLEYDNDEFLGLLKNKIKSWRENGKVVINGSDDAIDENRITEEVYPDDDYPSTFEMSDITDDEANQFVASLEKLIMDCPQRERPSGRSVDTP